MCSMELEHSQWYIFPGKNNEISQNDTARKL